MNEMKSICVYLQTISGSLYNIYVKPTDTIRSAVLSSGIPKQKCNNMYCFFRGKLINPDLSFLYYKVSEDDLIVLCHKKNQRKHGSLRERVLHHPRIGNGAYEELLRITDVSYNLFESSRDAQAQIKSLFNQQQVLWSNEGCSQEEEISVTSKAPISINSDPLPLCFENETSEYGSEQDISSIISPLNALRRRHLLQNTSHKTHLPE